MWEVYLCLGCGGVVGGGRGLVAWSRVWGCVMSVCYESGLFAKMIGPGICIVLDGYLRILDAPSVQSSVAPYRYLLINMYLSVADIANPYFLGCCRTRIRYRPILYILSRCHRHTH